MAQFGRRTILLGGGALAVTAGAAYGVFRSLAPAEIATGQFFHVDGIAIRGTDPVAYFTENKPVAGLPEHAYDWSGATWHFANAQNRAAFVEDPIAYAPQYGGYCAWAVAAKSKLFSTQPANWSIVEGRLFLNYNDGVQDKWNTDRSGFISKADEVWPSLLVAL